MKDKMESSGHFGYSWMTWTMPMTWPFFLTLDIRCRKRPALLQTPQHKGKSKVLKVNTVTDTPIVLEGDAVD